MTDQGTELDEILSEGTQPTQDQTETTTTETTDQPAEGQSRDDKGRFAAKADEQPETEQQPTGEQPPEPEPGKGTVPQAALHASREREKEARQEAEQLRQMIQQMQGQIALLNQRQATPPQPKEEPKAPDFWDNPNEFVTHALTPVQQQMQQQRETFSRMLAVQQHGQDTVQAAYQAMGNAIQQNPAARGELQRIMSTDHPYDELVQWHRRQETMRTVGNDPQKWFEAEMEKRLSDPAEQAKIMERIRGQASKSPASAGQAPVTEVPPSLNRLPGGGSSSGTGSMSDAALFEFATAKG